MTARQRSGGFTLIEVMAAIGLLAVFTAAAVGLSAQLFQSHRSIRGYSDDLLGCQRTLRAFRSDVVAAHSVQPERDGARLTAAHGEVVYRLHDGRLTRTAAGVSRVLSRSFTHFLVEREGELVRLQLELGPRARTERRRRATLATAVRLQGEKP